MTIKYAIKLILLTALLVVPFACKNRDPVSPLKLSDRQIVLNSLGNSAITPGLVDLQTSFNALRGHVKTFTEDSTNVAKLLLLRDQWLSTAIQLKTVSVFAFGPVDQRFFKDNIASPINSQAIDELLARNISIDSTVVMNLPADSKGIGAVEYLIFGENPTNYTQTIESFTQQAQKTAYLRSLCDDMQKYVNLVLLKWSRAGEGYVDTFIGNDGDGPNSSIALLYSAISSQVSLVRKRIEIALALKRGDGFRPDLIEAPYSSKSLELLKAEIGAIQPVFTGRPITSSDSRGFNWLLGQANAKKGDELLSQTVMRQFDVISTKIDQITPSLEEAVFSNPSIVTSLITEIDELKSLIESDVRNNLYLHE
ncbi:imelysin family protein [Dyadobacter sp. CY261]|uniref:imelysin family protein n=1 Tax=Dyadobacter sp. CY261 TaxID=2907203 RepID=UPI001F193030|nr:imelysin family protein [Dyadobacter sp. CY261]MCF0075709.1 imelysin family protein [Dyadobacter sp. CY261]